MGLFSDCIAEQSYLRTSCYDGLHCGSVPPPSTQINPVDSVNETKCARRYESDSPYVAYNVRHQLVP
ncbi:hypothetical protein K440DRAFT_634562 [Wilcoxina mikolae CBS 423.85]|nr:hypothetical protein K440DRAFT_634562 [Wilcoxina mikolae CBS 423.85]